MPFTDWSTGDVITATKLDNDNSVSVGTDTVRTITVTHSWTASQTFTGGFTAAAACTIDTDSATALTVGVNGATNPAFLVDASTASSATGIKVKSAAAASGVALSVISSGTDENLTIDAKGSGTITLGGTSTGALVSTRTMYIGDTSNANATFGLTINQGANDNEITSWKSSDVAHGVTGVTETDTFGLVTKASASAGGVLVKGLTSADVAYWLMGVCTTEDTTKTTSGFGVFTVTAQKKSGTGVTNLTNAGDGNLFVIRNDTATRFIGDAEGSWHCDVGSTTF